MTNTLTPELVLAIARTYFKMGSLHKEIILDGIEAKDKKVLIRLVSSSLEPDAFPIEFEDELSSELRDDGLQIVFSRSKVSEKNFKRAAFRWELALNERLGYGVSRGASEQATISDLFDLAASMRTSDVHFMPRYDSNHQCKEGVIQFRIDGVLQSIASFPVEHYRQLCSWVKRKSGADLGLAVTEGSFRLDEVPGITCRVASMKTSKGVEDLSSVCVRLLREDTVQLSLGMLNYLPDDVSVVKELLRRRSGVIVICGETGAGKTTTMGSMVSELIQTYNCGKKVVTLEDPIEFTIPGAVQFEISKPGEGNGLTYVVALENILRQDPDVIVVGEIRNADTAKYVVTAAQTGHLLITTMHSEDTISALTRLAGWGIDGPSLNNTLLGVISQFLIRRNCPACLESSTLSEKNARLLFPESGDMAGDEPANYERAIKFLSNLVVGRSTGVKNGRVCEQCEGLRFFGRVPIVEVYSHNQEHSRIVAEICKGNSEGPQHLRALFQHGHYAPFALNALRHVLHRTTSPEEVIDQLPRPYFVNHSALLRRYGYTIVEKKKKN
ncbi:Flp pilus assembly complex ATPase component TadA [Candidatus Woesearchaeota archaeon]|nr:Flp pilus assembly complex ATPase component TadA [Candidatus Woesearchaeota archaeon]